MLTLSAALSCYWWCFSGRYVQPHQASIRVGSLGACCDLWSCTRSYHLGLLSHRKELAMVSLGNALALRTDLHHDAALSPETFQANILLRRAKRLRKLTGNDNYRSQSELDQAELNAREVVFEALVRPIQLMVLDPAIGFTAAYVALCYGIYYSFFEAFPIVYIERYHFNLGEMGLTFLSITAATILSLAMYYLYIYKIVEPDFRAHGLGKLERRLLPALYASLLLPIGLFIFAWTSDSKIHWIVSVIGVFLFTIGGKLSIVYALTA